MGISILQKGYSWLGGGGQTKIGPNEGKTLYFSGINVYIENRV